MRIAHIIYTNGIAGAEKYLLHLLPPMNRQGIESHLIIVCAPGSVEFLKPFISQIEDIGIPLKVIVTRRRGFINAAKQVHDYLSANKIGYIHSHLLNSDVLSALVKLLFNRKLVIISTKHGYSEKILEMLDNDPDFNRIRKLAKRDRYYYVNRLVMKLTDHNYAVSNGISRLYQELGLTDKPMPYIHHGISVSLEGGDKEKFRFGHKQLIIVGRLEEFKGHKYLIQAMPAVVERFPGCRLLIIGHGSRKAALELQAESLGVKENVMFLGFQHDPYSYVYASDIVIVPSLYEPFGLVYIEAFAMGKPVIAFNTPAGNEIIKDDHDGLLVEARDTTSLAEQIIRVLENEGLAEQLGERSRKSYEAKFTTGKMVSNTIDFYRKIMS